MSNKIEKFFNYLKRKREKYRLEKIKMKSVEEVEEFLNIDKKEFGS
jgi:hypothetical protein